MAPRTSLWHQLTHTLFPNFCFGCDLSLGQITPPICDECLLQLEPLPSPRCSLCAMPHPPQSDLEQLLCERCLVAPPPWRGAYSLLRYSGPVAKAWRQVKYQRRVGLIREVGLTTAPWAARQLALWQAEYFPKDPIWLLPVPMHPRALHARGFNQSMLLCDIWSKWLTKNKIRHHVVSDALLKNRHTPSQASCGEEERRSNLAGTFSTKTKHFQKLRHQNIVIIDDILTTGATAMEVARQLPESSQTFVLTLARAYKF